MSFGELTTMLPGETCAGRNGQGCDQCGGLGRIEGLRPSELQDAVSESAALLRVRAFIARPPREVGATVLTTAL